MNNENMMSPEINELMAALSKVQAILTNAVKDKENPFYKSSYADLTSIWDCCREPLSANGLAIVQTIEGAKDAMFLITILGHASGQWIKSKLPLILTKLDAQGVGSAISYARRYALSSIVGVCTEDDDGEKAVGRQGQKKSYQAKEKALQIEELPVAEDWQMDQFWESLGSEAAEYSSWLHDLAQKSNKPMAHLVYRCLSNMEKAKENFSMWKNKQK